MLEILLLGTGGHARSCIEVLEQENKYKIAGLVSEKGSVINSFSGYPILGDDSDLNDLRKKYDNALITVGQIKTPKTRIKLFKLLKELDFFLPIIKSPRAHISKRSSIGEGSIIMHDVIINTNAKIGNNCIINNKSLIEHDARIGDNCHISTGTIINGKAFIGNGNFIGSGVVTKEAVKIGNNCIIGAGVIIKNDIYSNGIVKS